MVNVPEISQAARENHTNYMNKEILQNIDSVVESISDEDVNNLAELYHMTKDDNEDEVIVNFNESEEVMDIKVEDLQDSEFSEYIPGSSDLIEIVKHEINVDDQDNTSHDNEDIMDDNSAVQYSQSNCTIAETPSPSLDRPPLSYIQEQFNRNQYPANGKIVENITARKWKSILDGKSSLNHDNNPLECTFCDFIADNVNCMLSHL